MQGRDFQSWRKPQGITSVLRLLRWATFPEYERRHSDVISEYFALSYQQQVTTVMEVWKHRHEVLGLPMAPDAVLADTISYGGGIDSWAIQFI